MMMMMISKSPTLHRTPSNLQLLRLSLAWYIEPQLAHDCAVILREPHHHESVHICPYLPSLQVVR